MITVQKYKAAIVDDSQEYRETVQSVVGKAGKQIDCVQFSRAETLVYELDDGDAYFDVTLWICSVRAFSFLYWVIKRKKDIIFIS